MKHYAYNSPFKMKDSEGVEYTLEIERDIDAESPREWNNVCTMVCWHRHYNLGDKHDYDNAHRFLEDILHNVCGMEYEDVEELSISEKYKLASESGEIYIKELNLYDHSGITISTSNGYPYNDRWDAGCVGFVYVTKEELFKERIGMVEEKWEEQADRYIESEVKIYDQYLRGDTYGYTLTKKVIVQEKCPHCGEVIREDEDQVYDDSSWGFYGDCLEDNGILDILGGLEFID